MAERRNPQEHARLADGSLQSLNTHSSSAKMVEDHSSAQIDPKTINKYYRKLIAT